MNDWFLCVSQYLINKSMNDTAAQNEKKKKVGLVDVFGFGVCGGGRGGVAFVCLFVVVFFHITNMWVNVVAVFYI